MAKIGRENFVMIMMLLRVSIIIYYMSTFITLQCIFNLLFALSFYYYL